MFAFQDEESFDKCVNETTFPIIIGSGEFWSLDPLCIASCRGRKTHHTGCWILQGLLLSIMYLTLPIYPAKASNVYFFCEMLIGIEQDAKKKNSSKQVYFSPLRWLKTVSSTLKDANFPRWL